MRDLKSYAEQYGHFERCLPQVLSHAAAQLEQGEPRRLVEANLEDELSKPRPHIELLSNFGAAVGAVDPADSTKATSELVDLYGDAARRGPVPLLAVVAAYETQAAEVAATKATALALHYDLDQAGTEFWTVHSTVEQQHSAWTVEALESLNAAPGEVGSWASRSAHAWWYFLDEREAFRAA